MTTPARRLCVSVYLQRATNHPEVQMLSERKGWFLPVHLTVTTHSVLTGFNVIECLLNISSGMHYVGCDDNIIRPYIEVLGDWAYLNI